MTPPTAKATASLFRARVRLAEARAKQARYQLRLLAAAAVAITFAVLPMLAIALGQWELVAVLACLGAWVPCGVAIGHASREIYAWQQAELAWQIIIDRSTLDAIQERKTP